MFDPVSTYRIQFHKGFTFSDLEQVLNYLQKLGVRTIYASPIFESTPGSTHGYDALNPHRINPEVGSPEQLQEISRRLREQGMGWLQDIVPNHMGYDPRNPWLRDVLGKGRTSDYAPFFDIYWDSPVYGGKVMVPFLGTSAEEAVKNNELKLAIDGNNLVLQYYETSYPVNVETEWHVLRTLPGAADSNPEAATEMNEDPFNAISTSFAAQLKKDHGRGAIESAIETINNDPEQLLSIVNLQHYRLCHWQETDHQINYRRFFTVNGLICLNMQEEEVFLHFHQLIKQLVDSKVFQGLRIDHIDGLYDPTHYLGRLKTLAGEDTYITVEKILQPDESLPDSWKIEGNTGYDFLAIVNNLFTYKPNEAALTQFYHRITDNNKTLAQQLRDKKSYILYQHMGGELENLYRQFTELQLASGEEAPNASPEVLKKTIGAFLVHCPVYRFYGNAFPLAEEEAEAVQEILERIRQSEPDLAAGADLLGYIFLQKPTEGGADYNQRALTFYQRCMQFSGPLMAKGFEDTLMYTYHRFIAHNEVGDSPGAFGYTTDEFHHKMKERQKRWPLSVNATSTHDTKRGEDVRARLNVLSDIAPQWLKTVEGWMQQNGGLKKNGAPDANDEYFIYQAIVGSCPMPGEDEDDFTNRLEHYLEKALREAKQHSNWTAPDTEYEGAAKAFARSLADQRGTFRSSLEAFQKEIVDFGIINSLVQVLLKFTCPGIPDVYQGTELWDLSFVDPDNRRPVDYEKRSTFLEELQNNASVPGLWEQRYSGKIKLWLTHRLLQLRSQLSSVFTEGEYIPLKVKGRYKEHVLAFARRQRLSVVIVAVPLHLAVLCETQKTRWQDLDWDNTRIMLPDDVLPDGDPALDGEKVYLAPEIDVKTLFGTLPFSVVRGSVVPNERGGGILLHISSLPSPFGIGDMGPEAKAFADFLHRSYQKYWQLLPLTPTEQGQGHSPYSSTSSKAGNTLLISPEQLMRDGLLNREDLQPWYQPQEGKTIYEKAEEAKKALLDRAWQNYQKEKGVPWEAEFEAFCLKEKEWLDDFALYTLLKEEYGGKPWYEWPEPMRLRDKATIEQLVEQHEERLEKTRWLQFIFSKQWHELKDYCNSKDIQLIGDMPFYVSYDSADVWAYPQLFKLDSKGRRKGVAGVPPDAFSEDGQLWGMPVFRWNVLKQTNYQWWVDRLRKNIELFDLVRLDHFRAFSAYWEVPAKEQTAKNGEWIKGPGVHFFKTLKNVFGELPFIAEDLGEIDEPVYKLRDQFYLPGMKVLQFAFSEDMPESPHIPHNYKENFIVYTGTHDNNTVRGWWREEGVSAHPYVQQYAGRSLTEDEIPPLFCRMAYASTARIAILPMQDVLGLDGIARMNVPSAGTDNWQWRLLPGQVTTGAEHFLKELTYVYNRR